MCKTNFGVCLLLAFVYASVHLLPRSVASETSQEIVDHSLDKLKSQYLPAEFAQTNFTLDDAKRLLRQKCKKAGVDNPTVYENLEQAAVQLLRCASSIANLTQVLDEIEAARPTGELDVVFQKYCERRPQAERCLHDFNEQLLPCLTPAERAQNDVLLRIVSSLIGFICYKNGDQIALFIAEEGPECIEANKENIANCMDATFAAYMPKNGSLMSNLANNMSELPDLLLKPKHCIDLYDFEECVLSYLEQCNEVTPANIIESMFKYVKNETKCQPEIDKAIAVKKKLAKSNGTPVTSSLLSVWGAVLGTVALAPKFMAYECF